MNDAICAFVRSEVFLLFVSTAAYLLSVWLGKQTPCFRLHPLLLAIVLVIVVLHVLGIDYVTYAHSTRMIHFLLGPTVVMMGYLLHEQMLHLRGKIIVTLVSIASGAVVGVGSVRLMAYLLGVDSLVTLSLEPKSVTTPIALSIVDHTGGNAALTAIAVVITGIVGAAIGPAVLTRCGIRSPLARGLAMGCAGHGVGTARALEMSALEGAFGGLAIGLMGIMTALLLALFP